MLVADTAVTEMPNAEILADIAVEAAGVARRFGYEPRVALLAFSTFGYPAGERSAQGHVFGDRYRAESGHGRRGSAERTRRDERRDRKTDAIPRLGPRRLEQTTPRHIPEFIALAM